MIWLSRVKRFAGNWILFTTAILLFSFGMLIQYRLYSDPEYNARNKVRGARSKRWKRCARATSWKTTIRSKKQMMGLPPTPAQPIDINQFPQKESNYSLWNALTSSYTWIPIFSFHRFRDRVLVLRARWFSALAAAQQFHHRLVDTACHSRSLWLRRAPAKRWAT